MKNETSERYETIKALADGAFRKFFAVYIVTGAGIFLFRASFKDDTVMKLVVGFVIGTLLTTLVGYYYGSSQSSQDKDRKKN